MLLTVTNRTPVLCTVEGGSETHSARSLGTAVLPLLKGGRYCALRLPLSTRAAVSSGISSPSRLKRRS